MRQPATATPLRPRRALFELPLALLCLWAVYFHTPLGALFRDVGARVLGRHSTARPLLAYYSGGDIGFGVSPTPRTAPPSLQPRQAVSPQRALGYGLWAGVRALPKDKRAEVEARLAALGVSQADLATEARGPKALEDAVTTLGARRGSPDAAVLELFAGEEPVRFAVDRTRAAGDPLGLDALVKNLPPGFDDAKSEAEDVLALGTAYGLSWPLAGSSRLSSGFGMRLHPVLGAEKMHSGLDLPVPRGTQVHVVADGVVRRASEDGLNGRMVLVDHGHGVTTLYLHNQKLLVSVGEAVKRGQVISLSGSTGRSTGPHLHYQLELFGRPVDPLAFRPRAASVAREEGP